MDDGITVENGEKNTNLGNSSSDSKPHTTQPEPSPAGVGNAPVEPGAIVTQVMASDRVPLICPSCNARVVTRLERKPTWKTHLVAGLLCLFGMWCCVCCPYCKDCYHNADHYCPNCDAYLGSYID